MTEETTTLTEPVEESPSGQDPVKSEALAEPKPEVSQAQPEAKASPETPKAEAEPKEEETPSEPKALKPEDYDVPDFVPPQMRELAAKQGLSNEQFSAVVDNFGKLITTQQNQAKIAIEKQGQALVKDWGDRADYNLNLVRRAVQQNDPDGELRQLLNGSGFGNHPAVLKYFLRIGESMQEGGFLKGAANVKPGQKTVAQRMFPNMPSEEL
jgi:pyruvate/2-oxoglutarate dehydrogenase complex dihydrolipoamide acyltransferase (E2) component